MQDVLVLDLAAQGCRMLGLSIGVTKTDSLALWFGEAGPFAGRLKWAKRGLFGVEFDEPIDERLLETLSREAPAPNVVPIRRGRAD